MPDVRYCWRADFCSSREMSKYDLVVWIPAYAVSDNGDEQREQLSVFL